MNTYACHFVALAFQVVAVGQDETLLTSVGFNDLARDGNLELFDVLCFDLSFDDEGNGSFRRRHSQRFTPLPDRCRHFRECVLLRRVSFPHL